MSGPPSCWACGYHAGLSTLGNFHSYCQDCGGTSSVEERRSAFQILPYGCTEDHHDDVDPYFLHRHVCEACAPSAKARWLHNRLIR